MSFLPGMFPAGALGAPPPPAGPPPAAFILNGSDEELRRQFTTTSPNTTTFTLSFWLKVTSLPGSYFTSTNMFSSVNALSSPNTLTRFSFTDMDTQFELNANRFASSANQYDEFGLVEQQLQNNSWRHFVLRCDTSQAAADDRIRMYLNGALVSDDGTQPALNATHSVFTTGYHHVFGDNVNSTIIRIGGKFAFIDMVYAASLDPTAFASNNGGIWTRKPYTGAFGTYGYSLTGADGFNDVSGNGQHFTGVNMTTGANLDFADLPPFIT
jgi:hypothetical protein